MSECERGTLTLEGNASERATQESFFDGDDRPHPEIVEGLIREGQLVAFAGPFGMGKSPMLTDLALHVIRGKAWCGREVTQRPIIAFDFETPAATYRRNIKRIAKRLDVKLPQVPGELDIYLEHDDPRTPATKKLLETLGQANLKARLDIIEEALSNKPEALVLIDPLELLFRIDTGKKQQILWLYGELRRLLSQYPHAAILMTFNLRKWTRK